MEERFVTQTFVAVQPDGLDPCDLRLAQGEGAVRELIAQRVPLFEFAIRSAVFAHDLESAEGRLAALDEAAPIIRRIKDEGLRQMYAVKLDRWLGMMDEAFVLSRVGVSARAVPAPRGAQAARRGPGGPPRPAPAPRPGADGDRYDPADLVTHVEREALIFAVQRPALCGPVFDALGAGSFTVPVHRAVFELIEGCGGTGAADSGQHWTEKLRAAAPDDRIRDFLTQLALQQVRAPRGDGEPEARYVHAILARVEDLAVSREIAAIKARLERTSPVAEPEKYNRTFGDLIALEGRHRALSEQVSDSI
jgi:DNA primase